MRRVLDTNAALYVLGGRLAQPLPQAQYFVSGITEIELLSYPSLDKEGEQRIRSFLADLQIVGLNEDVKEAAVRLRRARKLKVPDAIIVATALAVGGELVSNDARLSTVEEVTTVRLPLK